jgi:hypothetical protein
MGKHIPTCTPCLQNKEANPMAPFAVCKNQNCSFVFDMGETEDAPGQPAPNHCPLCQAKTAWYCPECSCPFIRIPTPLTARCWHCGLDLYRSVRYRRRCSHAADPRASECCDQIGPLREHEMCHWNCWDGKRLSLTTGLTSVGAGGEFPAMGQAKCSRFCVRARLRARMKNVSAA